MQMSCDIVWLFGQLVTLRCKKTCLTSRLRALASLFALLFPPYEKQLLYNFLLPSMDKSTYTGISLWKSPWKAIIIFLPCLKFLFQHNASIDWFVLEVLSKLRHRNWFWRTIISLTVHRFFFFGERFFHTNCEEESKEVNLN